MLMLYCLAAVKMNHEKMQNGTCIFRKILLYYLTFVKEHSSIAQSVEHAAVNRAVVGSSPTRGVLQKWRNWQTRTVQVRVVAIPCGFDSHLLHGSEGRVPHFFIA